MNGFLGKRKLTAVANLYSLKSKPSESPGGLAMSCVRPPNSSSFDSLLDKKVKLTFPFEHGTQWILAYAVGPRSPDSGVRDRGVGRPSSSLGPAPHSAARRDSLGWGCITLALMDDDDPVMEIGEGER